jgi:predicted Zn-dependent peptidase
MALESPYSRCEQLARQTLIYGRVKTVAEIVDAVDAVDAAAVEACMARLLAGGAPALASLGPVTGLPGHDAVAARLG